MHLGARRRRRHRPLTVQLLKRRHHHDRPRRHPDRRADRGARPRARRHPPARRRRPRRGRPRLHLQGHQGAARLRGRPAGPRCMLSALPPFWLAGTAALSLSKILDNMEIGHNVMHGQYDWMRDPALNSQEVRVGHRLPGRPVAALAQLHAPHVHQHPRQGPRHRLRHPAHGRGQKWNPYYLGNPVWAFLLMVLFQYGVALHDLETENIVTGKRKMSREQGPAARHLAQGRQAVAEGLRPVPGAHRTAVPVRRSPANATANLVRNLWAYSIIFCGHFPTGVATFTEEETEDETRGAVVRAADAGLGQHHRQQAVPHPVRQPVSHQIEHHLFPDIPARRYPQIAARGAGAVREVRPAVQHRPVQQADRLDLGQDLPARPADGPRHRTARRRLRWSTQSPVAA